MHPKVSKYIEELKAAHKPYITTDTQVLSGRVVFTVNPSIQSDEICSVRMDMPENVQLEESAYWLLFLVAVIGPEKFIELQSRMKQAMTSQGRFEETVNGWALKFFWEDNCRILFAESKFKQP